MNEICTTVAKVPCISILNQWRLMWDNLDLTSKCPILLCELFLIYAVMLYYAAMIFVGMKIGWSYCTSEIYWYVYVSFNTNYCVQNCTWIECIDKSVINIVVFGASKEANFNMWLFSDESLFCVNIWGF